MPQDNATRRRIYHKRIKENLCPKCLDNPIEPDTSSCKQCKTDMRQYRQEHLPEKMEKDHYYYILQKYFK